MQFIGTLKKKSKPAVVLLNNVFYDTGVNAQEYHNAVGDWYGIPHVSIKDTLYQKMKQGMYKREELTPDGLILLIGIGILFKKMVSSCKMHFMVLERFYISYIFILQNCDRYNSSIMLIFNQKL